MLNEKRITEAKSNFNSYLREGLIKKEPFKSIIFETYMRNHRESLIVAEELFKENKSSLWVIVTSYYSMFYIANAILYKLGYKIGSSLTHKVTADSLIFLVRNKLKERLIEDYEIASNDAIILSSNIIQSYEYERTKRSVFQYETTEEIKKVKAQTSLNRAKEFSKEVEKLILNL